MAKILVVDDDVGIRLMLSDYLGTLGYTVAVAADGSELEAMIANGEEADLFVVDVALPGIDGLALARMLRTRLDPGIVMLTASGDIIDRVVGLEVGADDYVQKPVALPELAARIDAVLRRRLASTAGKLPSGLLLDLRNFEVRDAHGNPVKLTTMEVDLVAAFATNPGKILSRDDLMRLAPPRGDESFDRSVDHRIVRLRRKIEDDPEHPALIKTVRGAGYLYPG
jgi:DNA-binding response OmpR family regulator